MPTWKYDVSDTKTKQFTIDGQTVVLKGGETITSEDFFGPDDQGLTRTSYLPAWNPLVERTEVTAAEAEDKTITLNSGVHHVTIYGVSEGITVDVYIHSKAVANKVVDAFDSTMQSAKVMTDGKVKTLAFTFSGAGSVKVEEWSE